MPRYSFTDPTGAKIELVRTIAQLEAMKIAGTDTYAWGDIILTRDYLAEHREAPHAPGNWPLVSDAAGIHPEQIGEFREFDKKAGVPTDYTPDGRVVFTSRDHRKRYCQAHGIHDKSGGYGDPHRR